MFSLIKFILYRSKKKTIPSA